jgi:hypothetical protein
MAKAKRTAKPKQAKSRQPRSSKAAVDSTDLEAEFHGWLGRVCRTEKPPSSIVAYNIGLFQTADEGYSAYLVGATEFSEEDADWACEGADSFTPKERYLPLPAKASKGKEWQEVLSSVERVVKSFLTTPSGKSSFLGKATATTVGFDDGDLVRVK